MVAAEMRAQFAGLETLFERVRAGAEGPMGPAGSHPPSGGEGLLGEVTFWTLAE